MNISPITYVENKNCNTPPTLLVHARSDDQVLYSNAVRLKTALDFTSVPHRLITPTGTANNHLLCREVYSNTELILFKDKSWVTEVKKVDGGVFVKNKESSPQSGGVLNLKGIKGDEIKSVILKFDLK